MLAYGRLLTLPATTEEKYYKQREEEEGNNFKPSVSQVLLGQYLSQPNSFFSSQSSALDGYY